MSAFPYRLREDAPAATLGLIVLQVDEVIEGDFRRIFAGEDVAFHTSRVPSGAELTPETIAEMEAHLPAAAALLPPAARFDAVGYACTSGATLIGPARVSALIGGACSAAAATDPLSAAAAGLKALGIGAVGIVSPYIPSVAEPIRAALEARGIAAPRTLSFGEEIEARVARIDGDSIRAAALEIGRDPQVEAVFLSCTNLRALGLIDELEAALGKPALCSNQALAWRMARLAGISGPVGLPGRLASV